jgi:2-polyprenyl-3-methyl-5-hydroxy-6-metoxy-1,4-benzoquinol methylase
MLEQPIILRQLLDVEPLVRTAFAKPRTDYRGRQIDLAHVLEYFYRDLYREAEIIDLVVSQCHGQQLDRILNVGAAYGFLDIVLRREYGCHLEATELHENIPVYCDLLQQADIPVLAGGLGLNDWPVGQQSYDLIIFGEVFEHLRIAPLRALQILHTSLKPNGRLILTTPNFAHLANVIKLAMGRNIVQALPEDDSGLTHVTDALVHIREYTLAEVKVLLQKAGFTVERAYNSHSWDCFNSYYSKFQQVSPTALLKSHIRSSITRVFPAYRREMIFLAKKS